MYIYIYIYIYINIRICIYICTCICIHTYIHTFIIIFLESLSRWPRQTRTRGAHTNVCTHACARARTHTHTHTHNTVDNRKRHKKSHHVLAKSKNSLFRVSRVRAHALMTNSLHWICRVVSSRGVMRCHNTQCLCHEVSQHSMFVQMSGKS